MRVCAIPLCFVLALLFGCSPSEPDRPFQLREGAWRLTMDLNGQPLPFIFELKNGDPTPMITVHNGAERIEVTDVVRSGDSLRIRMPLFDSEFIATITNDSTIKGKWSNYLKGTDYHIPFVANAGHTDRFPSGAIATTDLSGHWEAHFSPNTDDAYDALGMFEHRDDKLVGTFCTETGDYRYLEGKVHGDSMMLSCFDGSHAFLFRAVHRQDSLIGRFWSGTHWQEPWVAIRNPDFSLRDPDSLTFLKEGYDMVDFRFPSIDGGDLSPKDERFQGKVVLVQVMGSWCPNCVDETRLLNEVHSKYNDQGLEVIALAFEKYEDPERAKEALRDFKNTMGIRYPIAYAGRSDKATAAENLPFLDHVMSFPTTIFIDRKGMVRRIRTGFYGPGTGEHYANYTRNLDAFVEDLLRTSGLAEK